MTLEQYLREKATPYRGGRMLGRVSIEEAATAIGSQPFKVSLALQFMRESGELENLKIGGLDGQTAIYMVAA
ncbi:MAG: hypothetical protein CMN85_10495 [Spongiibacteraceae bacterium]|nr:hypothetical protein [Spongiibacteraceae bacterium]|tara:strand:+ start:2841 stop:3056 length:216 start_codon:yes stop_codon:yes gene_type:complete